MSEFIEFDHVGALTLVTLVTLVTLKLNRKPALLVNFSVKRHDIKSK